MLPATHISELSVPTCPTLVRIRLCSRRTGSSQTLGVGYAHFRDIFPFLVPTLEPQDIVREQTLVSNPETRFINPDFLPRISNADSEMCAVPRWRRNGQRAKRRCASEDSVLWFWVPRGLCHHVVCTVRYMFTFEPNRIDD